MSPLTIHLDIIDASIISLLGFIIYLSGLILGGSL